MKRAVDESTAGIVTAVGSNCGRATHTHAGSASTSSVGAQATHPQNRRLSVHAPRPSEPATRGRGSGGMANAAERPAAAAAPACGRVPSGSALCRGAWLARRLDMGGALPGNLSDEAACSAGAAEADTAHTSSSRAAGQRAHLYVHAVAHGGGAPHPAPAGRVVQEGRVRADRQRAAVQARASASIGRVSKQQQLAPGWPSRGA